MMDIDDVIEILRNMQEGELINMDDGEERALAAALEYLEQYADLMNS